MMGLSRSSLKFIERHDCCGIFVIKIPESFPTELWLAALESVGSAEKDRILSYLFKKDQERALLSVALQRKAIKHCFGAINFTVARTPENKPYLCPSECLQPGTWNFNVSHHGDFVGIAWHWNYLIGVDIVDLNTRANWVRSLEEFLDIYRRQLTDEEMRTILSFPTEAQRYQHFFVLWALKESYVKAVGVGIGINLQAVHFEVIYNESRNDTPSPEFSCADSCCGRADMTVDGNARRDWKFDFFSLDGAHVMAISRGPPGDALRNFQQLAWKLPTGDIIRSPISDQTAHSDSLPTPQLLALEDVL